MRYDLAIVGKGPAGLSALLNAKIRNKSVIIFGKNSKNLEKTESIKNYLAFEDISGQKMNEIFLDQVNKYDYKACEKRVQEVYAMGDYFSLLLEGNEMVEATACIIATGRNLEKDLEGEEKFFARGISYCATCDAALYRGKKVVVIGYNEEAVEEANFTSEIVDELIFVNNYKKGLKLNKNIEVIEDAKPLAFEGNLKAERLILDDGRKIEADGFFIIKDSSKPDRLVPSVKIEGNKILTDKNMATNISGLFAAGDITGAPYQIMKAVGEGQIAALNAASYISKKNK
jgi:thioredoxin reductase (NADPH)